MECEEFRVSDYDLTDGERRTFEKEKAAFDIKQPDTFYHLEIIVVEGYKCIIEVDDYDNYKPIVIPLDKDGKKFPIQAIEMKLNFKR